LKIDLSYIHLGILSNSRDVTSHKELWEGNGNSHCHNSDTAMEMGREPGISIEKKICRRQLAIFGRELLASRRRCLRGFLTSFLGVQIFQKKSGFRWTIQIIMTLTPPAVF